MHAFPDGHSSAPGHLSPPGHLGTWASASQLLDLPCEQPRKPEPTSRSHFPPGLLQRGLPNKPHPPGSQLLAPRTQSCRPRGRPGYPAHSSSSLAIKPAMSTGLPALTLAGCPGREQECPGRPRETTRGGKGTGLRAHSPINAQDGLHFQEELLRAE